MTKDEGRRTKDEILEKIKEKFGAKIKDVFEKSARRVYIEMPSKDIVECARCLFAELEARFSTASCVDMPDRFEILYHFSFDPAALIVSIRVFIDKKDPKIGSITPLIKGAEWIEREIHELFGVDFTGHPNLKRLLLPDSWPEGLYPLRRDYKDSTTPGS